MAGNKKRPVTVAKLAGKTILASLVLLIFAMYFMFFMNEMKHEYTYGSKNRKSRLNYCDSMYYDREYGQLMSSLRINECYDKDFDKYWEICEGFSDYLMYIQYSRAAANDPGYEKKRDEYAAMVLKNDSSCVFEDNKRELSVFADDVRNGTEKGIQ